MLSTISTILNISRNYSQRTTIHRHCKMASKKVFLEKVLALRPDMAGSDEKEKVAISSLVSETSKMGSDIKVSSLFV